MAEGGWIGVDLDGCLAEYHGWDGGAIGPPVPLMLARVRQWLEAGIEVRIVTARVAMCEGYSLESERNADDAFRIEQEKKIAAWCMEHFGKLIEATAQKDFKMIELWDDRCVQVEKNTGRRVDGLETG